MCYGLRLRIPVVGSISKPKDTCCVDRSEDRYLSYLEVSYIFYSNFYTLHFTLYTWHLEFVCWYITVYCNV